MHDGASSDSLPLLAVQYYLRSNPDRLHGLWGHAISLWCSEEAEKGNVLHGMGEIVEVDSSISHDGEKKQSNHAGTDGIALIRVTSV